MFAACSLFGGDDGPVDMTPEKLRSAPESVTIEGRELALRTYMWRDFMPISPPGGHPLIAVFWIYSVDSTALPTGLTADAAWVVNGDRVWDTFFESEGTPQPKPYELERIARDGPNWGPHIEVDAVVRIRESDGTTHLLRAASQSIHRTD